MKIRRGSGRAQFASFNFPNNPIWAIESTGHMQIAAGARAAMVFRALAMRSALAARNLACR
jgi:hypothetical protein